MICISDIFHILDMTQITYISYWMNNYMAFCSAVHNDPNTSISCRKYSINLRAR